MRQGSVPAVAVVFSEFVTVTCGKEKLSKVAQPRVSVSTGGKKKTMAGVSTSTTR